MKLGEARREMDFYLGGGKGEEAEVLLSYD
jgi:hypothetical protein